MAIRFFEGTTSALRVALGTLVLTAAPAVAQESKLTGDFILGAESIVDPAPGSPLDSHAYLTITGKAAKAMFKAMKVKEQTDLCREGWTIKSVGDLSCSRETSTGAVDCGFSVDLRTGLLAGGIPC
jgi:hypothetical protein